MIAAMEQDSTLFAETLFSVGKGWLYPGVPLADFQREQMDRWDGDTEQMLELVPRGHMKTTLARIWLIKQIVYALVDTAVVFTGSDDNKGGYRLALQAAFTNHLKFRAFHYFLPYWFAGREPVIKDNEDYLELSNKVRLLFRSVLSKNRGINIEGRPDLVLLDDILPDDARTSDAVREKVTDIYFSSIRFIGESGAKFRAVGTTIHPDDIWSQIKAGKIGGWDVRCLEAHDDDFNNILWPARYPDKEAFIKLQQEEFIPAGRMHLYNAELRNKPGSATTYPFADVAFPTWSGINPLEMYRVMWIDHASGTGGDDFAMVESGEDETGKLHWLDVYAENVITETQKLEQVYTWVKRRRPHMLGSGRTSESIVFLRNLATYLRSKGVHMGITEVPEVENKNERIVGYLQPRYEAELVLQMPGDKGQKIKTQAQNFDKTKKSNKDDVLDCMSRCAQYSRPALPQEALSPRPNDNPILAQLYDDQEGIRTESEAKEPACW